MIDQYSLVMLNLGCGGHQPKEWINIDYDPFTSWRERWFAKPLIYLGIIAPVCRPYFNHDLRKGIPFEDCSVDIVYHSHFLEHIDREHVGQFMQEIYRILKHGGIHRVVVPNLEYIIVCYRNALLDCKQKKFEADERYDWALLELFDQMVRTTPGGWKKKVRKTGSDQSDAPRKRSWRSTIKRLLKMDPPTDPASTRFRKFSDYWRQASSELAPFAVGVRSV